MRFLAILLLCCLLPACAGAKGGGPALAERPEWGRFFQAAAVEGTLVVMKDGSGKALAHDVKRAREGFLPASSFKIENACIALETGVVSGPDEVFTWDGVKRSAEAWNKDLTLREAFAVSCVPVFQEIARRIGEERMRQYVRASGYGNMDIGGGIDSFWLEGNLRISALEQVEYLQRLKHGTLPFSVKTMDAVKDVMASMKGEGWTIRAKTGWATKDKPGVGWWVGWVDRGGDVWYFALNIAMDTMEQAKARQEVVLAALKAEGVLP